MIAARVHRRRMMTRPRPEPGSGARRGDVMPYDYGATFPITGRPGNVVQSVINTAPDSLFVAVAIGYGFEEDRGRSLSFLRAAGNGTVVPGDITLGELATSAPSALIEGFRVNPRSEHLVFREDARRGREFTDDPLPESLLNNGTLFQQLKAPAEISFLFSILDSGTGRELQDEPTHNLASLGKSNGERPFRLLAQPITFLPRSTIRLQIIERSQGVRGTLFVVFYGYQVIGSSCCPEPVVRKLIGPPMCPTETIGSPLARVIPFDYVTTFELTGRPQTQLESEVTVNAEGGFVATSIGYGLLAEESAVLLRAMGGIFGKLFFLPSTPPTLRNGSIRNTRTNFSRVFTPDSSREFSISPLEPGEYEITYNDVPLAPKFSVESGKVSNVQINVAENPKNSFISVGDRVPMGTIDLEQLPLGMLPHDALLDGLRVKPQFVRLAFENSGELSHNLPLAAADQLFERLNRPEDVSFRYTIFDSGRGRELQNQPLHNVAGLGIADGDRPFKKLARSMVFLPRSTIRIRVEERFGRGTLFIVLQGYKFLSTPVAGAQR
jgi:hypothetical protein